MFERRKKPGEHAGQRFVLKSGKLPGALVLLCSICLFSGCAAISTTATSNTISAQSQPTIAAQPFHTTVQTLDGDFSITLDITPNRSGTNIFLMQVMSSHTNKPASHIMITLYTTMQDMAMGTDSVVLHSNGKGQFSATSNVLSMGGHWTIGIAIQTADHVVHKAGVSLVTSA